MARLQVKHGQLLVWLNWVERLIDARLRRVQAPVAAIESIEVFDKPYDDIIRTEVDLGWIGNTRPTAGAKLMTLGTHAKQIVGGRAAIAVYLNRPAVTIRLGENETGWRLIVMSSKHANKTAADLRSAVGL